MNLKLNITPLFYILCIFCISLFCSIKVLAQQSDSSDYISRSKNIKKIPSNRANIQSYKRNYNSALGYIPFNSLLLNNKSVAIKQEKNLTVLKIYPNPVDDQITLVFRMDREMNLSIKIMDLLGNEVVTLSNERLTEGEQTKTYTIPNRLNSGIYFLRIVAGAETIIKRISVL